MAATCFIILTDGLSWRVGRFSLAKNKLDWRAAPVTAGGTSIDIAKALRNAITSLDYTGQPVLFAVPASWCLAATMDAADLPGGDYQAMTFRLEESLPLPAEQVVADFAIDPGSGRALGVCLRQAELPGIISGLEIDGIRVQSIVPAALLVAQYWALQQRAAGARLLLMQSSAEPDLIHIVHLRGGVLLRWNSSTTHYDDLRLAVDLTLADVSAPEISYFQFGVETALIGRLSQERELQFHTAPLDDLSMANAAALVLDGAPAWIELRRGALATSDAWRTYRRPLNELLSMGIVLLLGLCVALFILGQRYDNARQETDLQLKAAFARGFPGWPVPVNIRAIVESEHRRASETARPVKSAAAARSGLETLFAVVGHLPPNGPSLDRVSIQSKTDTAASPEYAISRLSVEPNAFEIEGEMTSYDEVDLLASALAGSGMHIAAPVARRVAGGLWNFILSGASAQPAKPVETP